MAALWCSMQTMQTKEKIFEVEHIVARRVNKGKDEYLVYWKGFDLPAATWEPIDNLLSCADLLDQFSRKIDPIPGANPISFSEYRKTKTVHLQMLQTRKGRYKRNRPAAALQSYMDTHTERDSGFASDNGHSGLCESLASQFHKKRLSESEKLIRDTLLHESKTMAPENTSMNNVNGLFGFGQDSPQSLPATRSPVPKRSRKQLVNGNRDVRLNSSFYSDANSQDDPFETFALTARSKLRDMTEETFVLSRLEKNYMRVTLNNVKQHNILTIGMLESMRDCFLRAKKNATVKAVLLDNNGDYFCCGIDYSELMSSSDEKECKAIAEELASAIRNLMDVLIHFPKPILAAVNGPALEFGVALVVNSDLAYASSKANFDLVFNKLSLTPIGCLSQLLPKAVGEGMANSMLYLGGRYQSVAAYDRGLILDIYGVNSFEEDIQKKMNQLLSTGGHTLESTKRLRKRFDVKRLEDVLDEEMKSYYSCLCSKETRQLIRDNWTVCVNLYEDI